MIDLFKQEYIGVMKRALDRYKTDLQDGNNVEGLEDDEKNVDMMLVTLQQLPALMQAFTKNREI